MKNDVSKAELQEQDRQAIRALIARQFSSLSWTPNNPADWDAFSADFVPEALLYPSARPAGGQTVQAFMDRMKNLEQTTLRMFQESLERCEICVFGNVAVAAAVCEQVENAGRANRSVEMFLLVRNDDGWRIASQAWDMESRAKPIPERFFPDETEE